MAKAVFRPTEITKLNQQVFLQLTRSFADEVKEEVVETVLEYTGPSADELRKEAEDFKKDWEIEKQKLLDSSHEKASEIIKNAEKIAFEETERNTEEITRIKKQADDEAAKTIEDAEKRSREIIENAESSYEKKLSDAQKEGFEKGHEDGYQSGKQESERLIDRIHLMLEKITKKRKSILDEAEQQIVELVLLIAAKVVKTISESERTVVMSNIITALGKVKIRGDVVIRVNLSDVQLTTDHITDFLQYVESGTDITVAEDSSVGRGGCIIETDFGAIDARISSQLNQLEQKLREISPIKTIPKSTELSDN